MNWPPDCAIKWSELQENQIYTITNATHIQTRYGDACIITLNNGQQVWAPSSLIKRFKQDKHTNFVHVMFTLLGKNDLSTILLENTTVLIWFGQIKGGRMGPFGGDFQRGGESERTIPYFNALYRPYTACIIARILYGSQQY